MRWAVVLCVVCCLLSLVSDGHAGIWAPGPYVSCVTDNSVVVSWITTTSTSTNRVDYGLTSSYGSSASSYQDVAVAEDTGTYYVHSAKMTGLSADTSYYYRVVSDSAMEDNRGAGWTVRTFPAVGTQSFTFIVYSDTQYSGEDGDQPLCHEKVMRGIVNDTPRLILHGGDIVSSTNNHIQWAGHQQSGDPQGEFFRIAGSKFKVMQSVWIAPCRSNHEVQGSYTTLFAEVFENPYRGNGMGSNTSEEYYAFDYANARIIFLRHNGSERLGQADAQFDWLVSELQAAQAAGKWIFVVVHQPPFVPDTDDEGKYNDGFMADLQAYVVPLFERYGVDMVFSGHNHVTVVWKKALHYRGADAAPPVVDQLDQGVHYSIQATDNQDLDRVEAGGNGIVETYVLTNEPGSSPIEGSYRVKQYDLSVYAAGPDFNSSVLPCYAVVSVNGNTCTVTTKGMYNAAPDRDSGSTTGTTIDTLTFTRGAAPLPSGAGASGTAAQSR